MLLVLQGLEALQLPVCQLGAFASAQVSQRERKK